MPESSLPEFFPAVFGFCKGFSLEIALQNWRGWRFLLRLWGDPCPPPLQRSRGSLPAIRAFSISEPGKFVPHVDFCTGAEVSRRGQRRGVLGNQS